MLVNLEKITPAKAQKYLAENKNNRTIRKEAVAAIARDIIAGNWHANGDAIRFNCDGELLDGQHRLSAIVKAGRPVETLVVRGIDKSARVTIDTGVKRTAADHLALIGAKYPNQVAATCRYIMMMREQKIITKTYTNSEVSDFYDAHPEILESVAMAHGCPVGLQSMVAAGHFILQHIGAPEADEFVEVYKNGTGFKGHPCLAVREKLIRERLRGKFVPTGIKLRLVALSMLKLLNGESVVNLRIPDNIAIPGWNK